MSKRINPSASRAPIGKTLRFIFSYSKPELARFIGALALILLNVAADVALPMFVSRACDELTTLPASLTVIIGLAVGYLSLGAINQAFLYFESMMLQKAGQNIVAEIRLDLFGHIEKLSLSRLDTIPVGTLVTHVAAYTASLSDLFTEVLVKIIKNVLTVVGVYAMMLYINWQLSLIMLAFIAVIAAISFAFGKLIGALYRKERALVSGLNAYLNENLSGIKLIHVFNREDFKELEFALKNEELRNERYKAVVAFGIYRPLITLIYIFAVAVTFYAGIAFGLEAGMIVAFYLYLSKFFNPIQNLSDQLNNLQKAFTAAEKILVMLETEKDEGNNRDEEDVLSFRGEIEFQNVWFAYVGEDWILKDVSFKVEAGQTCAFVGATGAGKTTILSLIVRGYEIQKGRILIDGRDIRTIKPEALRRATGQMLQDVYLFSGTVRDNIAFGDENICDEKIEEACRFVNAYPFIEKLDGGLSHELSDRGENLSQGQRQLLSFARTVVHEPQILILDEATASIDTATEAVIQDSLEKMRSIGTMLVVAHRLSTIRKADKIIVLRRGKVIEEGTHASLSAAGGYYARLAAAGAIGDGK